MKLNSRACFEPRRHGAHRDAQRTLWFKVVEQNYRTMNGAWQQKLNSSTGAGCIKNHYRTLGHREVYL